MTLHKLFVPINKAEKIPIKQIIADDGWSKRVMFDGLPQTIELKPETY